MPSHGLHAAWCCVAVALFAVAVAGVTGVVLTPASPAPASPAEHKRLSNTSRCGQPCTYKYYDRSAALVYTYDFSSLCSDTDYELHDPAMHVYYANICGNAQHYCLPGGYETTLEYGTALQFWGVAPPCSGTPACKNKGGTPVCCTPDCEVIGAGTPYMSLIDPANPATGGVRMLMIGGPLSKGNPFNCQVNPVTGKDYVRQVVYEMLCDRSVTGLAEPVGVVQNATIDCFFTMQFRTARACGDPGSVAVPVP